MRTLPVHLIVSRAILDYTPSLALPWPQPFAGSLSSIRNGSLNKYAKQIPWKEGPKKDRMMDAMRKAGLK